MSAEIIGQIKRDQGLSRHTSYLAGKIQPLPDLYVMSVFFGVIMEQKWNKGNFR
jgi:hypothetical protein